MINSILSFSFIDKSGIFLCNEGVGHGQTLINCQMSLHGKQLAFCFKWIQLVVQFAESIALTSTGDFFISI